MLKRLADKRPQDLLSLLVMLYIAIGIPCAHPFLHPYPEHGRTGLDRAGEHVQTIADEAKVHQCPLCAFQATNQLHAGGVAPAVAAYDPMEDVCFVDPFLFVTTFPRHFEARAPPAAYFL